MISSGSGFVRQDEKYSRFMAGKSVENYIALDRGEFAYNKGNSKSYEFGCVFPLNAYERGLVPNVYVCFKLSPNLNASFYEHLFRADFLHDQLGALVNTGVRNNGLLNIKPMDFLGCRVPVPPLDEQNRIAEVLTTAAKWIALQERDLEVLKQEKVALMSQLLTGKRRVNLAGCESEAQA
jgi:type I restriction enzyme S subunit